MVFIMAGSRACGVLHMKQSKYWNFRPALVAGIMATAGVVGLPTALRAQNAAAGDAADPVRARAEAGDAQAQMALGYRFHTGTGGVPKDMAQAIAWYRKAAEQGDVTAQNNLGLVYHKGSGVPVDLNEARRWYLKAAEQKFAQAQFNLGTILAATGRQEDQDEAMTWFVTAAELGYEPAKAEIAKIEAAILAKGSSGPVVVVTPVEAPPVQTPVVTPPPVAPPATTPKVSPPPAGSGNVAPPVAVAQPKPQPVRPPVETKPLVVAKVEPTDPSLGPSSRVTSGEFPAREVAEPLRWYPSGGQNSTGGVRPVIEARVSPAEVIAPREKSREGSDAAPTRSFYSKATPEPVRYDGEEKDRKAFEAYLNSSQDIERDEEGRPLRMKQFLPQAILDGIHPNGTARSIKVHDLIVKWKKDRPTGNFDDIIEYSARLTLFWRSPSNPDGFTKLTIVYDAEIERYTRGELLVTNGPLKRSPIFQVGQGSGVPLVIPE